MKLSDFNEKMQSQINEQLNHIENSRPRQIALLESDLGDAPLGSKKVQRSGRERILVRVTSRRRRLIDEDNLCEKYHVDLCRYAGIVPDDSPEKLKIEVGQIKCGKEEPEEIIIELIKP